RRTPDARTSHGRTAPRRGCLEATRQQQDAALALVSQPSARFESAVSAQEGTVKRIAIVWATALVGCVGCASASYRVAHVELDPTKYEQLGYAEGDATWVLILNIIPFGRPDQIHRAMEDAIQSKHGEEIVDVTIEESWFLNGFSVH